MITENFDEYDFFEYCKKQYLSVLSQDEAWLEIKNDTVFESVKSQPSWVLVCWLGEYIAIKKRF